MKVNENYKIESDKLNLILLERVVATKKDEEGNLKPDTWKPIAYTTSLESMLNVIVKRELFGTGFNELQTVNKRLEELSAEIKELVKDIKIKFD